MGKKHFSDDKPGRRGPAATGNRGGGFRPTSGDDRRSGPGNAGGGYRPSAAGTGGGGSYGNRDSRPGAGSNRPGRPERGGGYSPARPAFGQPGGGSFGPRGGSPAGRPDRPGADAGKPRSYGNSVGRRFDRDARGGESRDRNQAQRDERRGYGAPERGGRDEQPARPARPYEPRQNWPGQPYRTEGQGAVPRGEPGERNRKFQKQNPLADERPAGPTAERRAPRETDARQNTEDYRAEPRETGADRPIRAARPFTAKPDFPKDARDERPDRSAGRRDDRDAPGREERGRFNPREAGREGSFGARSGGEQRRDTGGAAAGRDTFERDNRPARPERDTREGRDSREGRGDAREGREGRPFGTPGAFGRKPGGARPGSGPEPRLVGSSGPGYFKQLRQQLDETMKSSNRYGRADGPKSGPGAGVRKRTEGPTEAPDYKNLQHYEDDKTRGNKRRRADEDFGTDELRLNRYIANAGICSRREADALIAAGEIRVNGEVVTEMGYKVQPTDTVQYGKTNLSREKQVYVLLNKPKDFITTTEDPEGRKTVMDLIANASKERIFPVGRLDRNTTGLLLFTNDGEVAQKLSHPSHKNKKIYQVELSQPLTAEHLRQIAEGLELEDGKAEVDDVAVVAGNPHFVGIEIHIGRNRIVRRIFEHLGYEIVALDRVQYAGLTKKDLPRGKWRFLSEQEVIRLKYFL